MTKKARKRPAINGKKNRRNGTLSDYFHVNEAVALEGAVYRILSANPISKHGMLTIEPVCFFAGDEKLTGTGSGACIGLILSNGAIVF
jgi:hypothetical protein